jgi:PAS domain S-box-containing protein
VNGLSQNLRRVNLLTYALALVFVAHVALVDLAATDNSTVAFVRQLLFILLLATGALICTVRAARVKRDRDAWALIAIALWAWTGGEVWFNTAGSFLPGVTDVGFVAFYVFGLAGLWRFCDWGSAPRRSALLWLDPVIGAMAVTALWWALMHNSMDEAFAGDGIAAVLAVAYPLFDLFFLVLLVVCVTSAAPTRGRALPLIGAGYLLVASADIAYGWQSAAGNYLTGALFDPLWPAGVLLIAAAAWQPTSRAGEASPRLQQVAPAAFAVMAVGMLGFHDLWQLPMESVILAIGASLAATLRSLGTSAGYLRMLQVSENRRAELDTERARAQLSETRLAEANRIARFGHWELDFESNSLTGSDELYRVLDFDTAEETVPLDELLARVNADDLGTVAETLREARLDRLPFTYVTRMLNRDGREIVVETRGQVDAAGMRAYGSAQDVTERVAAERAVRNAEELFRRAFDDAPVGVSLIAPDGTWLRVNKAYKEMFGYSDAEFEELTFRDITFDEDNATDDAFLAAALRGEIDSTTVHKRYRHRDGHEVRVRAHVSLIRDEHERPAYFIAQLENTGERDRGLAALERLGALVEASEDAILSTDVEGEVTSWNPAATRLFGRSADEAVGSQLETLLGGGVIGYALGMSLELNRVTREEFSWIDPKGTERELSLVGSPIQSTEGGLVGVSCVVHDISLRVTSEAARRDLEHKLRQTEKLESVGRLAGGVAHDFNNLLSVILNYADFLIEGATDEATRDDLCQLRSAAERGAQLTRQLLLFTRRGVTQPQVFELDDHLLELEPLLLRTIGDDVTLRVELKAGHGWVRLDPSELDQIVMNLAINARQAMPEGGTLTISTGVIENVEDDSSDDAGLPSGRYLALTVSDTGIGMSPETADRALEPFFTTKGSGTGLGLATVYGAATTAGGSVRIQSEEGSGTSIRVLLPSSEPGEPQTEPAEPVAPGLPAASVPVIVVEDEDQVRDAAARILTKQGYAVETAASPKAALALARRQRPDVVLTDVVMPGMPGTALVEQMREFLPDLKVVYMSGYNQDVVLRAGMGRGEVTFVQKPFDSQTLTDALGAAVATAPAVS